MSEEENLERWKKHWDEKKQIKIHMGKSSDISEDVHRHKASLVLGRDFGENMDSYLNRRKLKKYWDWNP